jgi:acetyl esterase/lipase
MKVRLFVGGKDSLLPLVEKYSRLLKTLGIKHQFSIAPKAEHRYNQVIEGLPFDALDFWRTAFSSAPAISK